MRNIVLFTVITVLNFSGVSAQWTKITSLPTNDIVALAVHSETLYAVSDSSTMYKSTDGGVGWSEILVSPHAVELTSISFFNGTVYVGTYRSGVFQSSDNGATWQNIGLANTVVFKFLVKDNVLYAATDNGVAVFNAGLKQWSYMNNSLPSYSTRVDQIIGTPNHVIIGAGANGTYYRYDVANNQWIEHFYYGHIAAGLQVSSMVNFFDTVYAANGQRIMRSDNGGETWVDDAIGSHKGYLRVMYIGKKDCYSVTNTATGGTWIQQRGKSATGSSWAINEEFLSNGFAYDIVEFQNKLFLAKSDGLYVKNITLGVGNPSGSSTDVNVFPNPSHSKSVNITCGTVISGYSIVNSKGQPVLSGAADSNAFTIQMDVVAGVYFVQLSMPDGHIVVRKFIVE